MHESHTYGSKIVTSCIQTNFSRLTDNSGLLKNRWNKNSIFHVREVVRTTSELLNNAQDWLEILWKLLPAQFWSHRKYFYTFGYHWKSSENLWKSLETFSDLRKSFKMVGNLRKSSVNLQKFKFCGDEESHAFCWKKVGRYTVLSGHLQGFWGCLSNTVIEIYSICRLIPLYRCCPSSPLTGSQRIPKLEEVIFV